MDFEQQIKKSHKDDEKQSNKDVQQEQQQQQQQPSPSSSPSHEFSFTISLDQSSTSTGNFAADKIKTSPQANNSFPAVDLSPADEIFFHGHLLPLHLLSHLPVSPRSSTNSLDSFTLPIKELMFDDQNSNKTNINSSINYDDKIDDYSYKFYNQNEDNYETKGRAKSKSFSLFGRSAKLRKENEAREKAARERQKRMLKLDVVAHVLKRYMKMVRPFLSSFKGRRESVEFHRQAYSFSGNLSMRRKKQDILGGIGRGEFSSPASMRTSPTNSGLLVATTGKLSNSSSDSTMEELQDAIQAAIAHCKNSIAVEDKIKCSA